MEVGTPAAQVLLYCLQDDNDSFNSILYDSLQPPARDLESIGYINITCADWTCAGDEAEAEMEGCTQNNMAWIEGSCGMAWRR